MRDPLGSSLPSISYFSVEPNPLAPCSIGSICDASQMTTLSCAGMSTLVGLYKSKPTDFDVARVGIHAVSNVFKHGSFIVSIFVIVFSYVTLFITKPYTSIYNNISINMR